MNIKATAFLVGFIFSITAHPQHDPGRNAVRLLAKGNTEEAIQLASIPPKKNNSPISEDEHYFVLAMAACQENDGSSAFKYARQAIEKGLPIERLLSGPREILKPLYRHPEFQEWIQARKKKLLHGPMLGSVSDSSASFWVRTADESNVTVSLQAADNPAAKPLIGKSSTSESSDYTTAIEITKLRPNTEYTYTVHIDEERTDLQHAFSTLPLAGLSTQFKIAFGGCAGFTPQHERIWTTIQKQNAEALFLLGDNVYIDDPAHTLTQQYCYYRRHSQPEWKQLIAQTSIYTIYDDHDFGWNDCIPGPDIEAPAWKRRVWEVFTENWNNPSYGGGPEQPGCWYDFYIADVHFIFLDCRYYRDLEGASMLGAVQKAWFLEQLASSKGTFKIIASSVPWSPGVKPGSTDTWDGYADEREEIFSFIEENNISGVVLMAADRHRSDFRKIPRPEGYDLFELLSARLTNVHTHDLIKEAKGSEFIMGYNETCSFGLVEFDTTKDDPWLKYSILNIDNEVVDSRKLHLSQLQKNR
ncbi:MAG: alkaline phosphatase D family protein [Coraliomargaritaceae bacterium]